MSKKAKTKKETPQLKTSTVISSAIIILFFLALIGNLSNSGNDRSTENAKSAESSESTQNIESIKLSIPDYQEEYDTLADIPIEVSVLPENADTSSLEYIVSDDSIYFSDTGITTGTEEGRYAVFVKSGDVVSNSITFSVVSSSTEQSEEDYNEEWARRTAEVAEKNAEIKEQYTTYVLNTATLKIHLPSCSDVDRIDSENYATSSLSREDLEFQGYTVCHHCFND